MTIVDDIYLLLHAYEEENEMPDDDAGAQIYLMKVQQLITDHFPDATKEDRIAAFEKMADYHEEESRKAEFMFKMLTGLDFNDIVKPGKTQ